LYKPDKAVQDHPNSRGYQQALRVYQSRPGILHQSLLQLQATSIALMDAAAGTPEADELEVLALLLNSTKKAIIPLVSLTQFQRFTSG